MVESTTARQVQADDEEWDAEEILDEVGINDDDTTPEPDSDEAPAEGPDELDDLPSDEEPAEDASQPPAAAESGVDAALDTSPPAQAGATGEQTPASDPSTQTEPEPLTLRVDNADLAFERSFVIDGMAVIPMDVLREKVVRNHLVANRHEYVQRERQLRRELELERTQKTAKEAELDTLISHLTGVYKDPDALTLFLRDFEQQSPLILEQAKTAAARQEAENLKAAKTREETERRSVEEPVQRETLLRHWIHQFTAGEKIEGLPDEMDATVFKGLNLNKEELFQLLSQPRIAEKIFVTADEDALLVDAEPGQLAVDLEVLYPLLRREAEITRRFQQQMAGAVETTRTNTEKAAGGARKKAGPTVAADGSPTPVAPATAREIRSRKDLDAELDELTIDDIPGF